MNAKENNDDTNFKSLSASNGDKGDLKDSNEVLNFSSLNNTINSGSSIIVLENNYTYDNSTDSRFIELGGIVISRDLTIDGQGHTIDLGGQIRFLNVNNYSITLKNINIINGITVGEFHGGAVLINNGNCTIINSTFTNNVAYACGGAVAVMTGNCEIINSTFDNNNGQFGGGLGVRGNASVINSTFTNNQGAFGAAVDIRDGICSFINNSFINNVVYRYGGAIDLSRVNYTFINSIFNYNRGDFRGGAIAIEDSNGSFINATFMGNKVTNPNSDGGGAVFIIDVMGVSVHTTFINSKFLNNTATLNGGAVHLGGDCNFINSTFINNTAPEGGALYLYGGSGNFTNVTFTSNIAQEYGGAVRSYGTFNNFTNALFTENYAKYGGAVYITGSGNFNNATFADNNVSKSGGALYLYDGSGNFTNSIFNNNTASVSGGAVYFSRSNGILTNSTFDDNRANSGAAVYTEEDSFYHFINDTFTANIAQEYGGAVYIKRDGMFTDSKFNNNSAQYGGAVFINNGSCTIINSTFTNNSASANGGALSIKYGNCTIINSTFINNTAKYGGAIFLNFVNYTFTDSTFKYNIVEMDGGAISILDASSGSFINATFMNNKINGLEYSEGGAVCIIDRTGSKYLNTFINSKFLNNSATRGGGAVYTDGICNFINSTFINNTAYTGGAVRMNSYYGNFINVTFIDNIAVYRGGAVFCNGDPFNFTNDLFIRNYAEDGGAVYNMGHANFNNSTFTDNHVNGSGGALYLYSGGGNLTNNIFNNNTADISGGAIFISRYNTNVYNSTFADNIANSAAAIYIVENTVTLDPLYVTFIDSTFIGNNATVGGTIFLNNSKQHSVFNVTKSQFKDNMGNIVYLTNADNITIDNDTRALSDFDLCCIYTNMTAIVMNYFYDSTGHILVNVSCLDIHLPYGIIQIIIGNKTYTGYLIEGQGVIDLDGVNVGYYAVSVLYNGSSIWAKSSSNVNFTVFKKDVDMDLSITNITYGEDAAVEVIFNETVEGFVYIKYDGKIYNVTVNGSKATIILDQLDAGNYTFDVTFDSNNYNQTIQSVNLTVFKANSTISANVEDEDYMENIIINVTTPCEDGVIYVVINNQTYKGYVIGGEGSIIVTDLEPGFYTCNVTYNGSDNYNSCVESVNFTVNKLNVTVVSNVEIDDNNDVLIHILTDGDDGVAYVIINNNTYTGRIVNRTGVINITGLLSGYYETSLVYNGSVHYNPSVVPVNFTVDKYDSAISVNVVDVVYGKDVIVNVTTDCDDGEIYIELNGQKYRGYILDGKGSIIVPSLEPGFYICNVTYTGSDNYNPCVESVNFTVNKIDSSTNTFVELKNGDVYINVLTTGEDSVAYVIFNGTNYTCNITGGQGMIMITGLDAGYYDANLTYAGNKYYNPSISYVNFVIGDKIDSSISVNTSDVVYGKDVLINVRTDCDDSIVYVIVNGQIFEGNIIDGIGLIRVSGLDTGNYELNVTYKGSDIYKPCVASVNFTVNPQSTCIRANDASYIINYGGTYKVNFDPLLEGVNITFTINGKNISSTLTDKSGIAVINLSPSQLSSIGAGSHNMIVSFAGNKNYLPFNTTVKVSINKENTLFSNVKSVKKYYKSNAKAIQLTATLKNSKNKVIKNQWVYFKVNNKKTYKVKTNSKGVAKLTLNRAKIKACKLNKKGNYKFTVTYNTTKTFKQATKNGRLKVLK